ncbi:phosphatase PAP2 family protein [Myxococcaceae bacterium GXIMD 01537]
MLGSVLSPHCVVAVACLLAATPALAEAPRAQATTGPEVHELRFDWTRDTLITGAAGVLWIGSEALFKDELAPDSCRWCDRAEDGTDTLNSVDRWGRGLAGSTVESRDRANTWSNILGFVVVPVGVLGTQALLASNSGASSSIYFQDAAIILQSAVLASTFNQAVKFIAGRERPFVHVLPEDQKALTAHPNDNNLSFFSGHTSLAFSLVVGAGTVAELRGYRHTAWLWAVGLPLAASVGLLRMGADKHYLTDVFVGALVGSAFGVAVPLLLHPRKDGVSASTARTGALSVPHLRVAASPGGIVLSGRF